MNRLTTLVVLLFLAINVDAQWTTRCGAGNGMIVDLASYKGSVYATGFFTQVCGANANYIARWDGTTWYPVGSGLDDAGHRISVIDTNMYVAQYKQTVDSNWLRIWDGSGFAKVGEGVYLTTAMAGGSKLPNLYDVVRYRGKLVVCGEFDVVGDKPISGIMQWDGASWDSLGSGLSGSLGASGVMYPHQMLVYDTSLYVVGSFAKAGGIVVNGVARWDGSAWHAVGAGFNGNVYGIGVINNEIYVGGDFTTSGSTTLQRIAKWNGSVWVHPGFGVSATGSGAYAFVHTIMQVGSRGIFEGGFNRVASSAGTSIANNIFAYSGLGIDTMGGGVVNANFEGLLAVDTATIYAGGAVWPATGGQDTTRLSEYHFRSTVSTPQVMAGGDIKIYPDPCSDRLTVECGDKGCMMKLWSVVGKEELSITINSPTTTVDISGVPAGIYIVQVLYSNGGTAYSRLIRQ